MTSRPTLRKLTALGAFEVEAAKVVIHAVTVHVQYRYAKCPGMRLTRTQTWVFTGDLPQTQDVISEG
jgi:hypothetical protein